MPLITTRSAASARGLGFCQQTGPRTSPISGYELWLDSSDASKFTYSSGSVISAWTDKSANGYVFQPSSTTYAPTRTGTQNSKSTVVFDGTDDFLSSTATASTWKFLHDGTPSTTIVVYKNTRIASTTGSNDENVLLDTTGYSFATITAGYQGYTLNAQSWYYIDTYYEQNSNRINSGVIQSGQSYPAMVSNTGYFDSALRNTWNVNVNLLDPNNATTSSKLTTYNSNASSPGSPYTGSSSGAWVSANTAASPSTLRIGWFGAGAYYPPFKGEIAEIILYKRKLSVAEKTEMTTYLKSKWNI